MGEVPEATVCFLRQDNHLLLAHIEYENGDTKWSGIGGFIDPGETKEDALLREVEEETYLKFAKERLQKVGELHKDILLHIYLTDYFTGEIKPKEAATLDLLWYPVHDLPYPFMHKGTRDWLEPILQGKYIKVVAGKIEEVASF